MVSIAILVIGAIGLLVICGGCFLAYSFGPWAKTATPTVELVFSTPAESPITPLPANTFPPAFTETPVPVTTPTITPTLIILPQQWNGSYKQAGFDTVPISIVIERKDGNSLTGKMVWGGSSSSRGAITAISGEFLTDFGDEKEQAKWGKHPDYQNGDRNGTWLKWTETGFISGSDYRLGGWYYGHIGSDGAMVGLYFLNDEITSLANDSWKLKLVK